METIFKQAKLHAVGQTACVRYDYIRVAEGEAMKREHHRWFSPRLGRDMEMLIFGHGGLPALVFPTSCGRFFEFEDNGMVNAVWHEIEAGRLQLFCVDSVDAESWYNRAVSPRWRIARHVQYEDYLIHEVVPLMKRLNWSPRVASVGCSFGGYHAVNIALRHPDVFTGFLSMGGAFDLARFLHGYHDQDVYYNLPTQYLPNMSDPWFYERYRSSQYVLATGEWDICRGDNERMADLMRAKGIPVKLDVWGDHSMHDWPEWRKMIQTYL